MNDQHDILLNRARELARPLKDKEHENEVLKIVEFQLGGEIYGLELDHILEVYPLRKLTPMPGVPSFVKGIINVRGHIVSVIDLRIFFEMNCQELTDSTSVIILQSKNMEFGILADAIVGIDTIAKKEIMPSLPTLTGMRADFLKGVSKERLVILDGAKLLADTRLIVDEEVI
jgi:purine-binding chemotaxis protein CheW